MYKSFLLYSTHQSLSEKRLFKEPWCRKKSKCLESHVVILNVLTELALTQ